MGAYLSIDLDFWCEHFYSSHAAAWFFRKVFSLNVPIVFVIEHEELLEDINEMEGLTTLYNVDYHSDLVDDKYALDGRRKPKDFSWANHIKNKENGKFVWIYPDQGCYTKDYGTCHGEPECDPFKYPNLTSWRTVEHTDNTKDIDWDKIEKVGVCLSPCFVKLRTVQSVIERLGCNTKEIEELIEKQPLYKETKRKRGILMKKDAA